MKSKRSLFIPLFLILLTTLTFAQKDPNDPGAPDTVWFYPNELYYPLPSGPGMAYIHIGFVNDYSVDAITTPFVWSGPLIFDSVTFRDSRVLYLEHKTINVDLPNKKVLIGAVPVKENTIPPGRGMFATLCYTINDVSAGYLDSIFFPPANHLYFVTSEPTSYVPCFIPSAFPVIEYWPGDVDYNQKVEMADVIYLAGYVFGLLPKPPYLVAADVNGDCKVELADAIYLADFLIKSGPPPMPGCIW